MLISALPTDRLLRISKQPYEVRTDQLLASVIVSLATLNFCRLLVSLSFVCSVPILTYILSLCQSSLRALRLSWKLYMGDNSFLKINSYSYMSSKKTALNTESEPPYLYYLKQILTSQVYLLNQSHKMTV